jgi:hypothetical protein
VRKLDKLCGGCGIFRDLEDFAVDRSKASGRKSRCRECDRERSRRYYAANREAVIRRVSAAQRKARAA